MDLSVELLGFKMKNPLMIASGPLTRSGKGVRQLAQAGAGAAVMKSVSVAPREGYARPWSAPAGEGLVNAEGLPNPGCEAFQTEVRIAKEADIPVIASIFGYDTGEYVQAAKAMEDAGSDALEILGLLRDLSSLKKNLAALKEAVKIPLIIKIGLRDNLPDLARMAEDAGADAITAITAIPALALDVENGRPHLGSPTGSGGLTGAPIKPIALKCVADIAQHIKIPIIAAGGVASGLDAIEMIMVGGRAVQLLTHPLRQGISVIPGMIREMEEYLEKRGHREIAALRGSALQFIRYVPPSEAYYLRESRET
jgi:dihydroorotate dehydrogenase (NAD+) catalytic subunit